MRQTNGCPFCYHCKVLRDAEECAIQYHETYTKVHSYNYLKQSLVNLCYDGKYKKAARLLATRPESVHDHDDEGNALFWLRPDRGNGVCPLSLLRSMLEAGIDVQHKSKMGETALQYLLQQAFPYLIYDHILILLLFGAHVRKEDCDTIDHEIAKYSRWKRQGVIWNTFRPWNTGVNDELALDGLLWIQAAVMGWPDKPENPLPGKQLRLQEVFLHNTDCSNWSADDFILYDVDFSHLFTQMEEVD